MLRMHHTMCNMIGTKVCDLPRFDGTGKVTNFIGQMQEETLEHQRLQVLDISLKGTHVH